MTDSARAEHLHLIACLTCGQVCRNTPTEAPHAHRRCPRCAAALHRRHPESLGRTWALLIAALILYIPANLLPVMHTSLLGRSEESTILQGVVEFYHAGSFGIAFIIFVASVVVPCTKFFVLAFLLLSLRTPNAHALRARAAMYRLVEMVGYWSMLDVIVVAVVTALVQFKALGNMEPRLGILFFGLVVILTMLSALSFDPRLIWDNIHGTRSE